MKVSNFESKLYLKESKVHTGKAPRYLDLPWNKSDGGNILKRNTLKIINLILSHIYFNFSINPLSSTRHLYRLWLFGYICICFLLVIFKFLLSTTLN